ncbi:flagellin lysine-N-methylase [Oribacterium sp. WCC10]|uniref:flagellin lysine-N-methylase n=1 Tax=Oribacterium sp. WCC10 TaxID=1855343 RepID=UPI0008E552D5|nr:flagellin lysine-N-methylase [Oribacterium sp. WCC10]SFG09597.1 lysine-N-methylase [Oribacterium sp. WCC10]
MIIEYPEYYERFRCIGGECPDTCCAGWEVDVDDDSVQYYKSVEGPFGDRLRKHICEENGDSFFPLTEKRRCPFLNNKNLCDIYINIGEESLCQTCTEYPRYFMDIGNYEQMDMSLSCMELGRIFYTECDKINYLRAENDVPGEALSEEEQGTLIEVLALRNRCIEMMQDSPASFHEKMEVLRGMIAEAQGMTPGEKDSERTFLKEDYRDLVSLLETMDSINDEWSGKLSVYRALADDPSQLEKLDVFFTDNASLLNTWMSKTAVYFIFRYLIDTCIDGDIEYELCLIHRSLKLIYFMLFAEWLKKGNIGVNDMIYVSHLYSKEVEHDDSNVAKIKNL